MEEIDVPLTGRDSQNHLFGTQAIIQAQEDQLRSGAQVSKMLRAAHWAALRQDLYMALTTRRSMQPGSLDLVRAIYRPGNEAFEAERGNDAEWASLAVLHCCDVTQFAYGTNGQDFDAYSRLKTANEEWNHSRPQSYHPFYRKQFANGALDVRYLADWHVMGQMYHLLAELLLAVNKPGQPQNDQRSIEVEVRSIVLELVGTAQSNQQAPSALLVASMAISMCGCMFNDRETQKQLYEVLVHTEKVTGWPTKSAREVLDLPGIYSPT
jgi:hypothetical protein